MDVGPREESLCGDVGQGGIVVLRSFGKFFGLAGVQARLCRRHLPTWRSGSTSGFGPWAVAGPALEYGIAALGRHGLGRRDAGAADERTPSGSMRCLRRFGFEVDGGTDLFRHLTTPLAQPLFKSLGSQGILIRSFDGRPNVLRVGPAWHRRGMG